MDFSYKTENSRTYLLYAFKGDDSPNPMLLRIITQNTVPEIAKGSYDVNSFGQVIKYDITGKTTLSKLLSEKVKHQTLIDAMIGITDAFMKAEDFMIGTENISFDFDLIFIDPLTLKATLICLPFNGERNQTPNIKDLFNRIMFTAQFDSSENCNYVSKIIDYLVSTSNFSIAEFKKLLKDITVGVSEETYLPPHLIRKKTNERIFIDKKTFLIGRQKGVSDYIVSDNSAISRNHARISNQNGNYFLTDENSTNHTYLNGLRIPFDINVKISDGDIIKFANEEFTFIQHVKPSVHSNTPVNSETSPVRRQITSNSNIPKNNQCKSSTVYSYSTKDVVTATPANMSLIRFLSHYGKEAANLIKNKTRPQNAPPKHFQKSSEQKTFFDKSNQKGNHATKDIFENGVRGISESSLNLGNSLPTNSSPSPITADSVQISAIAKGKFNIGEYLPIDIVIYEDDFRSEADSIINQIGADAKEVKSGYVEIERRSAVRVVLTSPDIEIEDGEEEALWCGKYLNFSFTAYVPENYEKKQARIKASIYVNGVIFSCLKLILTAGEEPSVTRNDIKSGFISYSSHDRSKVAAIVQGMEKARPDLKLFFDIDTIRSGAKWEEILHREIENRDVLFLFWSTSAKNSYWVDKEWRYAYTLKGGESIEPVPIETPDTCPPPKELEDRHFNDRLLYIINK